jgi:hypothetical protein
MSSSNVEELLIETTAVSRIRAAFTLGCVREYGWVFRSAKGKLPDHRNFHGGVWVEDPLLRVTRLNTVDDGLTRMTVTRSCIRCSCPSSQRLRPMRLSAYARPLNGEDHIVTDYGFPERSERYGNASR